MFVFTPVDLPYIAPDDWGTFWQIWNNYSKNLVKVKMNELSKTTIGENNSWIGLDIYKKYQDINTCYNAPFFDIRYELPKLYDFLSSFDQYCYCIRICQSLRPIQSHTDDNSDRWSLRAYFHYTDKKEQWYLTKPFNPDGRKTYIKMPEETNWFMYNDKKCWHGTDFNPDHRKLLLQVFTYNGYKDLRSKSTEKYKDNIIKEEEI